MPLLYLSETWVKAKCFALTTGTDAAGGRNIAGSPATEPSLQPPRIDVWIGKDAGRSFNVLTEMSRKVAQTPVFYIWHKSRKAEGEKVQPEVPGCSYSPTVFKKEALTVES